MADFLDRLVARSRAPVPQPRGLGPPSFAVEEGVSVAPGPPAAPASAPAAPTSVLPVLAAPAVAPTRTAPAPPREPEPAVVRVEVAEPVAVDAVARPTAEPAEVVRVAPPGPVVPPPPATTDLPSARPRIEADQQPAPRERVVERSVESRTDVRTETVTESRTERVSVVAPQVARPVTATQPRLAVPRQPVVVPGAEQAPPAVHIHIGRLDVRGADEPAPASTGTPVPAAPAAAVLSLGDYLHGRAEAPS